MPIPSDLNTEAAVDNGFAEEPDPTLEEAVATPLPFLRVTATYAGALTTGHPDTISVDLDIEEVDAKLDADGNEPAFIRFVVRAIAALRADREVTSIVFSGDIDPVKMASLRSRISDAEKSVRRGLPPEVIARVLADPRYPIGDGQVVTGPGAADTEAGGVPYDDGGVLPEGVSDVVNTTREIEAIETSKAGE